MGSFHDLLRQKQNLSLHIIGMELNLNCLPDDRIHLFEFGGVDAGIMELNAMLE
jgi:hypothetical protein